MRKRTNTFRMTTDGTALSGKLTRSGDLQLLINGHEIVTVEARLIPALAHWLSSVHGRYADVDESKLQTSAPVLPLPKRSSRPE